MATQLSLLEEKSAPLKRRISGLTYKPNYLSSEQEAALIAQIDRQPWNTDWKRRVQHYGYQYHARTRSIREDVPPEPLPDWLAEVAQELHTQGHFQHTPDQAI